MTYDINTGTGFFAGTLGIGISAATGALASTLPWVAVSVSTATLAWVAAAGGGCAGIVGYSFTAILIYCGLNEKLAEVIGIVVSCATEIIVTAAILISTGMAAGTAFTIAASTVMISMAIGAAIYIAYIALKICGYCTVLSLIFLLE